MKYEYFTFKNDKLLTDSTLNEFDNRGWELVSFAYQSKYIYIFRREIQKDIIPMRKMYNQGGEPFYVTVQ